MNRLGFNSRVCCVVLGANRRIPVGSIHIALLLGYGHVATQIRHCLVVDHVMGERSSLG